MLITASTMAASEISNRQPRSVWVSRLLQQRDHQGIWTSMVPDLLTGNRLRGTFANYFRMDETCFEQLLTQIAPVIRRQDTQFRRSVSPQQRLAVTLRYLATGCSFTELHYNFRISVSLISSIILETCKAIHEVSKNEYLCTYTSHQQWQDMNCKIFQR